jgi:hypothetical protein
VVLIAITMTLHILHGLVFAIVIGIVIIASHDAA